MSMTERNASYIYVGNVANGISDVAYTGMAAGSICVVRDTDNKNEESALSGTPTVRVRIVQKKADGTYVFSPTFTYNDIVGKQKLAYAAPTEQVSYWGYDGTSNTTGMGSITTGNTYTLHFVLNHTRNMYNNAPQIKTVPFRAQSTSEADLAAGLQLQFTRTFSLDRDPSLVIRCERVANGTYNAAVTGWTFQNGSTTITKSAHSQTPAVGTAIRLATADPQAVVTAPVYRVVSYATNTITLDVPYQGADSAAGYYCSASVAPTAWGLKFTGLAQTFDPIVDSRVNQKVYFDIVSEDFGSVSEYKATKMTPGNGTYEQVSAQEIYSQFLDKDTITSKRPRTKYRQEATSTNTYNVMNLTILASDVHSNATGLNFKSYFNITLAFEASLTYDNLDTVFTV